MSLPTPFYDEGGITIYCGDNRRIVPLLDEFDLLLTDPPYGIAYDPSESTQQGIQRFAMVHGDAEAFDPEPFLSHRDVILWGANNYCNAIPGRTGQWYFWDKVTQNDQKVRIAEGEFAWHKRGTKPRCFRHLWSGAYRASESGIPSVHPTQKPVQLMSWCINLAGDIRNVLDPFMGSGTTLVAAKLRGLRAVGIEINKDYCEAAVARLSQGVLLPC